MSSYYVSVINLVSRMLPRAVGCFRSVSHQLQQKLPEDGSRGRVGAVYTLKKSLGSESPRAFSFLESYLETASELYTNIFNH